MFLQFTPLLIINPKWQQATILHKSKAYTERDRHAKMAANPRDTLHRRKAKRPARTGPARPPGRGGGLKIELEKIPEEPTEPEPKAHAKHQRERWTNISQQTTELQTTSRVSSPLPNRRQLSLPYQTKQIEHTEVLK